MSSLSVSLLVGVWQGVPTKAPKREGSVPARHAASALVNLSAT